MVVMDPEGLSVGELAAATGLTVRTLHHYDSLGLVCPSERIAAGHRRYRPADVEQLCRVQALRALDLSSGQPGRGPRSHRRRRDPALDLAGGGLLVSVFTR